MASQTIEDTGIRIAVAPAQSAFFAGESFAVTVTFTNTRSAKASAKRAGSQTQGHKRAAHSISLAPLARPPTSPVTPRTSVPPAAAARSQDRGKGKHERKGLVGLGGTSGSANNRMSQLATPKGKSMSVVLSPQDIVDVLPPSAIDSPRRDSTVPPNHPHARKQSYDSQIQAELQLKELSSSPAFGASSSASASTSTFSLSLDTISEDTHSYPPKKGQAAVAHLGLGLGPPPASPDAHTPPRTALASTFAQPGTELVLYAYAQLGGALTLGAHADEGAGRTGPAAGAQAQALAAVRGVLHRQQAVGGGRMDISSSLDAPSPPTPMSRHPSRVGHARATSLSSSIMGLLSPPSPAQSQFPPQRRPVHKARSPSLFGSLLSTSVSSPPAVGLARPLEIPEDLPPDTPLPTFDVQPAMLAVDLVLAPGESRSYSYTLPLPANLPPTYRGRALKFTYHLVVGVCRAAPSAAGTSSGEGAGPGSRGSTSQVMRVPVRIYNHVDAAGERRAYDLLWPVLHRPAKDVTARVVELGRSTVKAGRDRDSDAAGKKGASVRRVDTVVDLQAYALQLLASLPEPCEDAARLQENIGAVSLPHKSAFGSEDGSEIAGCREAVEILTRNMRKVSFDVNKDGVKVAVLTFTKSAYRLGETIVGAVEINERGSRSRVLKLSAMLESQETLPESLAGSSAPQKKLRKLHAEFHSALTPTTLRVPFALDIPSDGTPAFECVCAPPPTLSSSLPPMGSQSAPGGLAWTVRLCLLVCVASPHARVGAGGLRLKHLVRDGVQGEWGSVWKATRGVAPLQSVDLRAERRAAAAAATEASGATGQGVGEAAGQQRGWASYLFQNLLAPHEREYHDGDEADSDDSNSEFEIASGAGDGDEEETRTMRGPYDPGVDLGGGGRGWAELRTETVECAVPVWVLPGNTAFRPMEVVFDV